ncbi:MAG: diaminopimelate decarboxylase [Chloroflexota bacterium]
MTPAFAHAARRAAARFGTPLQLTDLPRLDADARAVAAAFPDPWLRLYAMKANGLPALLHAAGLPAMGFGATAVSRGELALAARAGFPAGRVALEGIGKGGAELRAAVAAARAGEPLLWTSLESAEEAAALARLARRAAVRPDVLVRVNPSVQPETHGGLAVGASVSKFGVLPDELPEVVAAGGGADGPLRWRGLHLHVGSQLGAVDAWRTAFRGALRLLTLQRGGLPDFDTLDIGSGFPVAYADDGAVPGIERFAAEAEAELAALPGHTRPARLAIEPGRAIVASSGWLVGRVLHVRDREPRLVVLDAGMTELIRPALYGAEHPMIALTSRLRPAPDLDGPETARVRVDGPVCESTDELGAAVLPPLVRGDLVAIGVTGAYGTAMASTYNGRPRPPEVAWDGDRLVLLRRRGTLAALP